MDQNLGIPVGLVRPTDRFDRELARIECLEIVDDDLGYFWLATAQRPRLKSLDNEVLRTAFEKIVTVDDYVRTVLTLEENHALKADG